MDTDGINDKIQEIFDEYAEEREVEMYDEYLNELFQRDLMMEYASHSYDEDSIYY